MGAFDFVNEVEGYQTTQVYNLVPIYGDIILLKTMAYFFLYSSYIAQSLHSYACGYAIAFEQ